MPNDIVNFLMFLFAVSTVGLAIIAELSWKTPNGFFFSVIRSCICISCIIFASITISPGHVATIGQFLSIGFIFMCSLIRFFYELGQEAHKEPHTPQT